MANQSGKKAITAEEMNRLLFSAEHRAACITYALANREKGYNHPEVVPRIDALLQSIAGAVKFQLETRCNNSIGEAMYPDGQLNPAWVAVRDYLDAIDPAWAVPNEKNPAQGVIAAKMVRCAILKASAPIVEKQKREREEADRKRREADRAFAAQLQQQEADRKRKADEAKRKADEAKREKIAKRRGTCGIEFAGASMRFIADTGFVLDGGHYSIEDATVFMYRGDLRLIGVHGDGVVAVDVHGTAYRVQINEGADPEEAVSQVNDWRWRGSESWEDETCPMPKGGAKSKDDDYF